MVLNYTVEKGYTLLLIKKKKKKSNKTANLLKNKLISIITTEILHKTIKGHSFLQTAVINKCDTSHLQKSIFFLAEIENSVLPLKQWSLKSSTQQNTVIEKL